MHGSQEVDMWEVSMNLAASTPAWKTPVKMFQEWAICKCDSWSCELYMFLKFKIRFGGKGIVQETWPESLKKKSSMHQEAGHISSFYVQIHESQKIPEIQSCFLFLRFMIRTFQEKIQPNKCVGIHRNTEKKKVAFGHSSFSKNSAPLAEPQWPWISKKNGSLFWCNEGFFHLFEGSSCKNIVISCKDAIHPLDDITLESPTHKQDWSFIQRQNSISSVYLEGFADANKKPQKKKYKIL